MSLKKTIRKNILEQKKVKEDVLIESAIIESRFLMIADKKKFRNFEKLKESEKEYIVNQVIAESVELGNIGLVNEQLGDIFKSLFGNALPGVMQTVMERIVNSLLSGIGIPDNFLRKVVVSYFSSHPIDAIKSLSDCKLMTKLLVESVIEALIVQYKQSQGITGVFADTLRNTVIEALESSETGVKLTNALSGTVCDIVSKITGKAKDVVSTLQAKPAVA